MKLIISLRTEFYGRLIDRLRRGVAGATGARDYLLTDLDRDGLIEAICRPTVDALDPLRRPGSVRRSTAFAMRPECPRPSPTELMRAGQRDGVLPLVQFLCDQLYRRVREREDRTVSLDDFEQIGRLRGGLRRHLEQQLEQLAPGRPAEQNAFKELLAHLTHRQADGTLTTELVREDRLAPLWRGSTPFPKILAAALELRLIRFSTRRLDDGTQERSISLGHDALARVADTWREEADRGIVDSAECSQSRPAASVVAACMAVLAIAAVPGGMRRLHRRIESALQSRIRELLAERTTREKPRTEPQLDLIYSLITKLAKLDPAEAAVQTHAVDSLAAKDILVALVAEGDRPKLENLDRLGDRI